MISPYSQGNESFKQISRLRADNIFSNYSFYKDIKNTNEAIYSNSSFFEQKYSGKKILIIGGGSSTNDYFSKNNGEEYDYLWSVNHFFLNPFLKNIKVDLAMMMLEPDIFSKSFLNYYENYKPILGFELHDKWKNTIIPYEDCFVMQTRFYGILGACQRMIIFASLLKAKQVDFIGLDGLNAIRQGKHAFQPGKKTLPSVSNDLVYQSQYKELWKYLYSFKETTKFTNLSKMVKKT